MITVDAVWIRDKRSGYIHAMQLREHAEAYIATRGNPGDWEFTVVGTCGCCGSVWAKVGQKPHFRCGKHIGRNPCAVEGCSRTCKGEYYGDRFHLCAEHYRIAAPPGSKERQVLNRLWRLQRKRTGKGGDWPQDLNRRYWRVWFRIVAIGRARTAGDIDMDEINKLFGWE